MSDRWVPRSDSKWSSERERAGRRRGERRRAGDPGQQGPASERFIPQPGKDPAPPEQEPSPPERGSTERIDRLTGGESGSGRRRSRRYIAADGTDDGDGGESPPSLPNLPGSDGGGGKPRGNRMIILGALLFLAMAAIAILPQLLGDDDSGDDQTPTPELIQTPTPRSEPDGDIAAAPTQSIADAEHIVCIDAGHGGWDEGRVREANSRAPAILEKEINLGMAWMLREELERQGIGVVMTRQSGLAVNVFNEDVNGDGQTLQDSEQAGDRDELQARINVCNEAGADVLISLHLNGFDDASARGYEVLYTRAPFREFGDRNADLATYIYRQIGSAYDEVGFETTPRGTLPDDELDAEMHNYGSERHLVMTGPGVSNADYTITPSEMPGVVIEPVFITNDDDAAFIAREENQRLLANAYADGILTYLEQYPDAP